jgi:flagellar biosynthesis/type III secretory pathway M-ring protein FliF/YscJ
MLVVIAVVVVIAAALGVVEVSNRRRRRSLDHLEAADPRAGVDAVRESEAMRSTAEGLSRSAHPGTSGAGGMLPGA